MTRKRLILVIMQALFFLGWLSLSGTANADSLAQIVEGAKKEGKVLAHLRSGINVNAIGRLQKELREKYGVQIEIAFSPSTRMPQDLSRALMEHKAGTTPTHDLMTFATSHIIQGNKAGVFELVEWKPLISKTTQPDVILTHPLIRGGLIYYTGHQGLMYNPKKIPADQVPRKLSELADPKWKGKVGIFNFTSSWTRWAFMLGKEKILSNIRAIVGNGSMQGVYADIHNRYLLGEVWMGFTSSAYLQMAINKGMPAKWQDLDLSEIQVFATVVTKGARHPNAAKLLAIHLSSPEGARFMLEEGPVGNLFYPGNYEHDISLQTKSQKIPEYSLETYPGMIDFVFSKKSGQWNKDIKLALSGK